MRTTHFLAGIALWLFSSHAQAIVGYDNAFTYQGELKENGNLANGSFAMDFSLWNALSGGSQVGSMINLASVPVNGGKFTVVLDFGESQITGEPRWLEIIINGNPLSPRQLLTPAPVAQALPGLWTITEGVTAPNLIGGDPTQINTSGGGSVIGGGKENSITTGYGNATIAGGWLNAIGGNGEGATVGGGYQNSVTGQRATIIGGGKNSASGSHATVAGGEANQAIGDLSWVAGQGNISNGANSAVLGYHGAANHDHCFVWADSQFDLTSQYFATTGPDQFLISAAGGVGINTNAPLASLHVLAPQLGVAPLIVQDSSNTTTLKVNAFGGVEIGPRSTIGALSIGGEAAGGNHIAVFYSTNNSVVSKMRIYPDKVVFPDTGEVFVGRESPITSAETFGVHASVGDGDFGGMYVSTTTQGGWPFYGYAAGQNADMWHYYDGQTGDWIVYNGGPRLTVESNGQVGIGTVDPAFTLHVNGSAGKPGGGSWSNASDVRLKKNIEPLEGSLESLLQLRGVTFEYIDPGSINELPGQRIGVIAQEVERVFPDWVEMREDGYKTVTFRGFEALTVEALRDLRNEKDAQIAELQTENAELRSRLEQLESLVAHLAARGQQ